MQAGEPYPRNLNMIAFNPHLLYYSNNLTAREQMIQFALTATLFLAAVTLSAESFTYQIITAPGATSTNPVGIDDQGQIVGNYTNSAGTYGFIDTGGRFTTLPGVKVINTSSNGTLLVSTSNGFATYSNGKYSPLTIPGYAYYPPQYFPAFPVTPVAINNSGQLLGNTEYGVFDVQFLVKGNQLTMIGNEPGGNYLATGLNNDGEAVSMEVVFTREGPTGTTVYGGIYNPATGNWTYLQAPFLLDGSLTTSTTATSFNAVNDLGQIVGLAETYGNGYTLGSDAILYSGGVFTYLPVPNMHDSIATGINDLGEIVGEAGDQSGLNDGFLAIPEANTAVPEPFTGMLCLLGLAALWVRRAI